MSPRGHSHLADFSLRPQNIIENAANNSLVIQSAILVQPDLLEIVSDLSFRTIRQAPDKVLRRAMQKLEKRLH